MTTIELLIKLKAWIISKLGEKQDTIPDLSSIRSKLSSAYEKPSGGIPSVDMTEDVQLSLSKADTALQSFTESDPTVPEWAKQSTKPSYKYNEIGDTPDLSLKQDKLISGTNIKTINNQTLLGSGNISISGNDSIIFEQVQVDWNQDNSSSVDYIKNKPTIPNSQVQSDWNQNDSSSVDYIKNKPTIPNSQVQVDWNATTGIRSILNKPTIPTKTSELLNDSGYLTTHQDISGKADKVSGNTNGNLAGLDSNGNLTDSGKKPEDFATSHQGSLAESAYQLPQGGIPSTDLDNSIQLSLSKANTALQSFTETDPTVPEWAKQSTKPSYDYSEINNTPDLSLKQDKLISGTNIKTINNQTILGPGNLDIEQIQSDWNATTGLGVILNKPNIPSKTSDLDNDSGFLTEHQSLSNYIEKSNTSGLVKNDGTVDTNTYLTQHQSLSGYATESYVNSKITELIGAAPEEYDTLKEISDALSDNDDAVSAITTTLTSKANSSDVYTKTESDTKYQIKGNYLTEHQSLSNYIEKSNTSGLVKNDGTIDTNIYLTEHQSLSNYIEKTSTTGLIKNDGTIDTNTYLTEHQSLSNYIEKSNTSGLIKNDGTIDTNTYLTEHQSLNNYIEKTSTAGLLKNDGTVDTNIYLTEHQPLNGYATEEWVNQQGYLTSHQDISSKADKTATVSNVSYNTSEKKIEKTINGITTNIVTAAKIVQDGGGITVETDPTVPEWAKQLTKPSYTAQEVGALPDDTLIPDPQIQSDWGQNDSTKKDYIKNKPTIPTIPTNISAFNNDSGYLTEQYILDDLATVAVSGNYADLKNTPEIPTIPTRVGAFTNDVGYLTQHQSLSGYATESWVNQQGFITSAQQQDISGKYDKTGGNISGNVDIDGELTLNIEDEDYDSGIKFDAELDDNLGTVLTLSGYANANGNNTSYKPILRNINVPNSNYDAANKKYVDDNIVIPVYHLVELNNDGSVKLKASSLTWQNISSNLTNPRKTDYLDIMWETSTGSDQYERFYVPCVGIKEVNNGDILFQGIMYHSGMNYMMAFSLSKSNDTLTTTLVLPIESSINKKNSIAQNSTSNEYYPTTKAVFDEFQLKPVVVWETSGTGLSAIGSNISDSPSWQLTNLDLTPYERVKIYSKCGQKSSATPSASTTSAMVLEMSLDPRAAGPYSGHFVGSVVSQNPNDANRLSTLTCAISSDKTSFVVLRMTTLYGTAATNNTDANGYVFKIVGYYN